jgi:hypothetical protein
MSTIKINKGSYRNMEIVNAEFPLIKGIQLGAKGRFVTVNGVSMFGVGKEKIRISIEDTHDVEYAQQHVTVVSDEAIDVETDEQAMDRIKTRFNILERMTKAAMVGDIRAMIVVGPPGVGKSYGVENQLERAGIFSKLTGTKPRYEVVKGAVSAIGLYATLYKMSEPGDVIVFDDCDSLLFDELSLNLLKGALDSGERRRLSWRTDSSYLRKEGIPDAFDFKGSIIFITNINFGKVRGKLADHLAALQSRCHYVDLSIETMRDKFLRIKQIHRDSNLFKEFDFEGNEAEEILQFMHDNHAKLREMSLRQAIKVAGLVKMGPDWRELAEITLMAKH